LLAMPEITFGKGPGPVRPDASGRGVV
jgi:hypothetical protein